MRLHPTPLALVPGLLLAATVSGGPAFADPRPPDTHPAFHAPIRIRVPDPGPIRRDDGSTSGSVEQIGETVIVEGDYDLLTDDGAGGIAIDTQDPQLIAQRFYQFYPDDYDEIILLTTFPDSGNPDALAYEIPVSNDVMGIGSLVAGQPTFDFSQAWGSAGKLRAFVDMKALTDYPKYDGIAIDDPHSTFYPTLGQEFAHRWLAFTSYIDSTGARSGRMLGRDHAHWSPLLQAQASVMDGNQWVDDGGGSFRCVARMKRYSELDMYVMGLLPARAVTPMYIIDDARTDSGHLIDPVAEWYRCEHVTGTREDVTIDQLIAAMGPRVPDYLTAPKSFRVAFVLVTRPGEKAGDVVDAANTVERIRLNWEEKFDEYSGGRGSVCTHVSGPCGEAAARFVSGVLAESPGNGNGVIEPGERYTATFVVQNDGPVAAAAFNVTAEGDAASLDSGSVMIPSLAPGASTTITFTGTWPAGATLCGRVFTVNATAIVGTSTYRGFAQAVAGTVTAAHSGFDKVADRWTPNAAGTDTATTDAFALGHPLGYGFHDFFTFQPDGGANGSDGAWFTGPERGDVFSGDTHSLSLGTATLWSPFYDLGNLQKPHLRFAAWFVAVDTSVTTQLQVAPDDLMLLEGSNDGLRWFKLDQIDGADDRWRTEDIDPALPLNGEAGLDVTKPMRFRFTVNRVGEPDLVEAGVDDFTILTDSPLCHPPSTPDGGVATPQPDTTGLDGCSVGGHGRAGRDASAGSLMAIAIALLGLRRRPLIRSP